MHLYDLYVLGAGFSRSFVPTAPLIEGFLRGSEDVIRRPEFRAAKEFMERCRFCPSSANIETLMTLADAKDSNASEQLKRLVVKVLEKSLPMVELPRNHETWYKFQVQHEETLRRFARYLLAPSAQAHVLTWNYDAILENALEIEQMGFTAASSHRRFHSGRCHGFHACTWRKRGGIRWQTETEREDHVLVLKLHGSMLWRVPASSSDRKSPGKVVTLSAHETNIERYSKAKDTIDNDMDVHPLIVPPVLDKRKPLQHPALVEMWKKAESLIGSAARIIFVGYSFPPTDYHAEYLFRANHRQHCIVEIINLCDDGWNRSKLMARYHGIFPDCNLTAPHWGDAATELEKLLPS